MFSCNSPSARAFEQVHESKVVLPFFQDNKQFFPPLMIQCVASATPPSTASKVGPFLHDKILNEKELLFGQFERTGTTHFILTPMDYQSKFENDKTNFPMSDSNIAQRRFAGFSFFEQ